MEIGFSLLSIKDYREIDRLWSFRPAVVLTGLADKDFCDERILKCLSAFRKDRKRYGYTISDTPKIHVWYLLKHYIFHRTARLFLEENKKDKAFFDRKNS